MSTHTAPTATETKIRARFLDALRDGLLVTEAITRTATGIATEGLAQGWTEAEAANAREIAVSFLVDECIAAAANRLAPADLIR
jgi:hypothetical protein